MAVTPMEVAGWNRTHGQGLTLSEYIATLNGGDRERRNNTTWQFHLGWEACVEMVVERMGDMT